MIELRYTSELTVVLGKSLFSLLNRDYRYRAFDAPSGVTPTLMRDGQLRGDQSDGKTDMGDSQNWGYHFRGPYYKDYSIFGSILGFPLFWEITT